MSITMKAWQHTTVIQKMKCLTPRWVVRLVVQNPVPDQKLDWLTPKPWHSCAWCDVQAIMRGFKVLPAEKILMLRSKCHSLAQGSWGCTSSVLQTTILPLQLVCLGERAGLRCLPAAPDPISLGMQEIPSDFPLGHTGWLSHLSPSSSEKQQ